MDQLMDLDSDPEVMRFLNGGRPTTRETVRARVFRGSSTTTRASGPAASGPPRRSPPNGSWAGSSSGRRPTPDPWWWNRTTGWGSGYATEGARALIRKGFTGLGVQRVAANTTTVNTRSRRVLEKAGPTRVRTCFGDRPDAIEGSEHGEVEYALTRADRELGQPDDAG